MGGTGEHFDNDKEGLEYYDDGIPWIGSITVTAKPVHATLAPNRKGWMTCGMRQGACMSRNSVEELTMIRGCRL